MSEPHGLKHSRFKIPTHNFNTMFHLKCLDNINRQLRSRNTRTHRHGQEQGHRHAHAQRPCFRSLSPSFPTYRNVQAAGGGGLPRCHAPAHLGNPRTRHRRRAAFFKVAGACTGMAPAHARRIAYLRAQKLPSGARRQPMAAFKRRGLTRILGATRLPLCRR